MTLHDFFETCECKSKLRVKSAYNDKILCYAYDPNKHTEIGKRELSCFWSEIQVVNGIFGDYAMPYICCYVDGAEEYRKEHERRKGGAE